MKINLDINLPGVDENEWEVVDYRRPQADEYYFSENAPTVQYCGTNRCSAHFILREIKRPEETNIIWHPIDDLPKLDPKFQYSILATYNSSIIHFPIYTRISCTDWKYWSEKYTHFAVIGKKAC